MITGRSPRAVDAPGRAGARIPGVIGHAGLAAHRDGGAPNRACLRRARRIDVDALEIDLVATADDALVLHHDLRHRSGSLIAGLTLAELRALDQQLLTLDEAVEELDGLMPLVLDVKSIAVVAPLCGWLSRWGNRLDLVVCTEHAAALERLRHSAPDVHIWRTFPDVGARVDQRVLRVISGLLAHRGTRALRAAGDAWQALTFVRDSPRDAVAHISGLPWRNMLPLLLAGVRERLDAGGITVHHPLVTRELCDEAHALGMEVIAWTVNDPVAARRLMACGVDMITTDRVEEIRDAVLSA